MSMFWADKIAKDIIDTGKYKPYWVDDMFTPSGYAHIGSLRGPLVHDIVYRALKDKEDDVTWTYVFNDFDPIDGLPSEFEKSAPYLGFPLRTAPSPEPGFDSFAAYFATDFQQVLRSLGVQATFLSSWDMYHEGKFNEAIKRALDNAEKILDIYQRVSGSKKREKGWLPLQVICEQCGRLGTTRVHDWDGKTVAYTCEPAMVTWAKGCGFTGRITPFDGNGKLPWKVDWPAHWTVMGVTIEGAGKDHSSAGGSRDIAKELCKEVFDYPNPYNIPYEFFLIGGKKMSSSKGLGLKGRDLTSLLPASVGRFLFTRTDYKQAIEFDPIGSMAIPDLFDEYDRCWQAYNNSGEEALARVFILSQIESLPEKNQALFIPRFRDIANYIQLPNVDLQKKLAEVKGSSLITDEITILKEREKYARIWLGKYAPEEYRLSMTKYIPGEVAHLSEDQRIFLKEVSLLLQQIENADTLQTALYEKAKILHLEPKIAFAAIYTAFIGKNHGPRAAWFLLQYPKDDVVNRLQEASVHEEKSNISVHMASLSRPNLFSIDSEIQKKFPSISIGIAIIKDVNIEKVNQQLEKEKDALLQSLGDVTTEQLGQLPEVISYRKLYKEMGVDWHSRRPSPEALLRRVALKKGLYTINTCVDAYNLVVMKHRVSIGAFDLDTIQFPTVLRFAKNGEEILLLGDEKPTQYKEGEIAYFDTNGGFNMDFNYRDAQRTAVKETTKNLYINVDGVYDISPQKVEEVLKEACESIVKYCGGTIEVCGVELSS